jgi:flagellar biosynthesis/type III secretory pathway M-ring protein FliF/YscJ
MQGELDASDAALLDEGKEVLPEGRLPVLKRRVSRMAQQEPENAARLVRSWLAEQER